MNCMLRLNESEKNVICFECHPHCHHLVLVLILAGVEMFRIPVSIVWSSFVKHLSSL